MTRAQLEHIIRAAGDIADDDELIIVDSQAILGEFPDAPAALLVSVEADLFPRNHPDRADLVDGSIGDLSPFHDTYGYYAQGVGPETAVLPEGWMERLVAVNNANTRGITGWCLEVHDLVISKLVAGRSKDLSFGRTVVEAGMADGAELAVRLAATELSDPVRRARRARLEAITA